MRHIEALCREYVSQQTQGFGADCGDFPGVLAACHTTTREITKFIS
jgi:hypothetical protein